MEARFDGNSELVAELVTVNGFKAAYAIKDGAEGPRGWKVFPLPFHFSNHISNICILSTNFFSLLFSILTLAGILQSSGLPWIEPRKTLSFDNLTDAISEAIGVSIWDLSNCISYFNADALANYYYCFSDYKIVGIFVLLNLNVCPLKLRIFASNKGN